METTRIIDPQDPTTIPIQEQVKGAALCELKKLCKRNPSLRVWRVNLSTVGQYSKHFDTINVLATSEIDAHGEAAEHVKKMVGNYRTSGFAKIRYGMGLMISLPRRILPLG